MTILMCAQKLTDASLIYRIGPKTKTSKMKKLKNKRICSEEMVQGKKPWSQFKMLRTTSTSLWLSQSYISDNHTKSRNAPINQKTIQKINMLFFVLLSFELLVKLMPGLTWSCITSTWKWFGFILTALRLHHAILLWWQLKKHDC